MTAYIEQLYRDRCNIIRNEFCENDETFESEYSENIVYENQPCRLSHRYSRRVMDTMSSSDRFRRLSYYDKLFISPEIEIFAGDKIVVIRHGKEIEYTSSEPMIYETHQEIVLYRGDYV